MDELLEHLSRLRPILETVYFLSSLGIVTGVWVAVRQLRLTRKIADTNVKRESAKLAADQCRYLADVVVPAFEKFTKKYNTAGLTFLSKRLQAGQPLIQLTNGEFANPNHDPAALVKEWAIVQLELIEYLNAIEYFAMPFSAGVADEKVAFPVAALPFIAGVNTGVIGLYQLRTMGAGRYESTLKLYTVWFLRLASAAAASAVPQMQQLIKNAATNKIDIIGGPEEGTVRKLYAKLWLKLKPKDLKA
jgi:hypothetical protein